MDNRSNDRRRVRGVSPELQQTAWRLRREMTPAEQMLRESLKGKRVNGLRFRAQHPIGQFVLDFYCPALRLAIEVDGDAHDLSQEQDEARTQHLKAHGYDVMRFRNEEIFSELTRVLQMICQVAQTLTPPELGAGGPLITLEAR